MSSPPSKQRNQLEWKRNKYATDPEYCAKRLAENKRYRELNRERINAANRERLKNDSEYRERLAKKAAARRTANLDESRRRDRERYKNDPEFRRKKIESVRRSREKKRAN